MSARASRNVAGLRFGRLVTTKKIGREPKTGYEIWELLCGCGSHVRRALWKVRFSYKLGHEPMCSGCRNKKLAEARTASVIGRALERRNLRRSDGVFSLYSSLEEDLIEQDVRASIRDDIGFEPEPEIRGLDRALDSELWPNGAAIVLSY